MTLLFFVHAVVDGMLMFRIPLPLGAGVAAVGRSIWGVYEMAVNEHSVNPETVRFNESLILGRQIIHILPEGSAELNPGGEAYCIDHSRLEVKLPIKINSTSPILMELVRTDLDTQKNETISISKSQIKSMHKDAQRLLSYNDNPNQPKTLYYTVKKPGLYVLSKVVDESNLEVTRKRLAHTVIVSCPRAAVLSSESDRCRGDLSKLEMEVIGTPPLTLTYRKMVNRVPHHATYENIAPDDFSSPLIRQDNSALMIPNKVETSWARSQKIIVPLSESLDPSGSWTYSVEEVRDAFGNRVDYASQGHVQSKGQSLHHTISVHERPIVSLADCTPQNPLMVARGLSGKLPVRYGSTGRGEIANATYNVEYTFMPQTDDSGDLGDSQQKSFTRKSPGQQPKINQAGMYTLTGVSTNHCSGEVLEPASCLLQNPPEPKMDYTSSALSDKCAGRPIGLLVDLDLIGTPPFFVRYRMKRRSDSHHHDGEEEIKASRGQLTLTPKQAGDYTYTFLSIRDKIYNERPLNNPPLTQNVKPSAFARFVDPREMKIRCIEDTASFNLELSGEGPFNVEYEVVHNNNRKKYTLENIERDKIEITTEPLLDGGEHTIALVAVTDAMGCKESLSDERKITVRHQKPRVGFRKVEGKFSVNTVESKDVKLQLRLEGDGPWTVKYQDQNGKATTLHVQDANHRIAVPEAGIYELTEVSDRCPGVVDVEAKSFEVSWVSRPEMRIAPSEGIERTGNVLVKPDVCEGDDDSVDVLFKGSPPFQAKCVQHVKLEQTRASVGDQNKDIGALANLAPLRMDTRRAGTYEYQFKELKDSNYDHSAKHFTPFILKQKVNSRPSAAFHSPNKNYKFCSVESDGEEVVPITLSGAPPFDLEIEIRHQSARPETVTLTGITSTSYNLRIPHSRMHVGKSAIYLRRVSDSRGCVRSLDSLTPGVQISVHDAPTISELASKADFCVGERIDFSLSGTAPFNVFYTFEGGARKAVVQSSTFRRLAEKPGTFTITGIQDSASVCKSSTTISKHIHGLPSVRVSHGKDTYVDIHEGGYTEILFEFGGVPPFEFTYTRSSNTEKNGKKLGKVLDMHSEISEGYSLKIRAHEEGTYEVVSIKDRYCSYSKPGLEVEGKGARKKLTH